MCIAIAVPCTGQPAELTPDRALSELRSAARPVQTSSPEPGRKKTKQDVENDRKRQADEFVSAAVKAREFQIKFPNDPNLPEVRKLEVMSLLRAASAGETSHEADAQRLAQMFISDARNTRRDRYLVAARSKQLLVEKAVTRGRSAAILEAEKVATELYASFPDVPDVYNHFIGLANIAEPQKARRIAADILKKDAPDKVKWHAQLVLDRLNLPGSSPQIKFLATNGQEFDLAKHRGTTVVVYFWASRASAVEATEAIRTAAREGKATFVGVNLDIDPGPVRLGFGGEPMPGLQRWEPQGIRGGVTRQLCVERVPSVYVFDGNGELHGFGSASKVNELLEAATK